MVTNRMVQDKGNKIQVVGSDVEALYPSSEAVGVAEIVYEAVLKTKIKFENIDWLEQEQACRLGPGTRPGITGEDPLSKDTGNQDQWQQRPDHEGEATFNGQDRSTSQL